jgi:phosphomannomutase
VDLLNYGAAAQTYRSYNTKELVNAQLTATQKAWGTGALRALDTVLNTDYKVISNPTVTWKGAGLVLEDSVVLRLKIATNSTEGLAVKIRREGAPTATVTASHFEKTDGGYYVYFDGLNASEMSKTVYLTVYKGETAVSNTLSYSVESYAYSKLGVGGNLTALLSAMMKYGDSAQAVAG